MNRFLFWQRISLLLFTAGALLFGIPCLWYGQMTVLSAVGLLILAASIGMDVVKLRCPFCRHFLGVAPPGKYCPHCGDQIKP